MKSKQRKQQQLFALLLPGETSYLLVNWKVAVNLLHLLN